MKEDRETNSSQLSTNKEIGDIINFFKRYLNEGDERRDYPFEVYTKIWKSFTALNKNLIHIEKIEIDENIDEEVFKSLRKLFIDDEQSSEEEIYFEKYASYPSVMSSKDRLRQVLIFNNKIIARRKPPNEYSAVPYVSGYINKAIERKLGKVVTWYNDGGDMGDIVRVSNAFRDEIETLNIIAPYGWEEDSLKIEELGDEINILTKGGKNDKLVFIPRKEKDKLIQESIVPIKYQNEKDKVISEVMDFIRTHEMIAELFKKRKGFIKVEQLQRTPTLSRVLLDLAFKEQGLGLKYFSKRSGSGALMTYKINGNYVTISRKRIYKTSFDPRSGEIINDLYHNINKNFGIRGVFESFRHGTYFRVKWKSKNNDWTVMDIDLPQKIKGEIRDDILRISSNEQSDYYDRKITERWHEFRAKTLRGHGLASSRS